ncbi:MAG: SelT/SelW/SelH family protein [Myxococcota bacterium]|nr:SelT/SelW/SelH family protein [Myxococcota bacterium]
MDSKDQESRPKLRVHYCPQCGWLARAAWLAQELLQTFSDDVAECALVPDKPGTFEVWAGDTRVWTREKGHSIPEIKSLKAQVRDVIAPDKALGHSEPA